MSWGGGELYTEAAGVELDVACRIEFSLAAAIAAGRYLPKLERAAEDPADLGADRGLVDLDRLVFALSDDEPLANIGSQMSVIREVNLAWKTPLAFAAEEAFAEVDGDWRSANGAAWADIYKCLLIHLIRTDDRAAAKYAWSLGCAYIRNELLALMKEYLETFEHVSIKGRVRSRTG